MKFNIVLVGCGGTGGCFFGRFVRFMADFYAENTTINLSIVDGDTVEIKNLGRQPFVEQDVGENKAVALAMAAEEALGVRVKAYPIYISESNMHMLSDSFDLYEEHEAVNILIGAVDNHACRKVFHAFYKRCKTYGGNFFFIDAANEYSSGDVVVGIIKQHDIYAPDRCHYYPEVLTDTEKPVYEKSCEELNASEPQHLATNSLAADMIFSYVTQLIAGGSLALMAKGGIIYFDAFRFFSRFDPYDEVRHGQIK